MEIIDERRRVRSRVIEEARKWAEKVKVKSTVILIGSYARGDFNLWSDIDILMVSSEFKGNPVERIKEVDAPPGFQVIPITLREFEALRAKGNKLIMEAVEQGIPLRDDLKILVRRDSHREGR